MLNDLVIVNLRANSTEAMPAALTNLQWQTCLRRIVFLHRSELEPRTSSRLEIYSGREAYQFLLEVICGLHSPLVGPVVIRYTRSRAVTTGPHARVEVSVLGRLDVFLKTREP